MNSIIPLLHDFRFQMKQIPVKTKYKKKLRTMRMHFNLTLCYHSLRKLWGKSFISKTFGTTCSRISYWEKRILNPNFHSGTWGGQRWSKFSSNQRKLLLVYLWYLVTEGPDRFTLGSLVQEMSKAGFEVNRMYLSRIFRSWKWSWKIPVRFHKKKYRSDNIDRYMNFLLWIQDIPWARLKFADESHFVGRRLFKKLALGPIGHRVTVLKDAPLDESYSMTLLTSLTTPNIPYFVDLREESNTQWDFVRFVFAAICEGALVSGDYLIVDNATVHDGKESREFFEDLLRTAGVTLIFLPAYSPELNPCELVFNHIKQHLQNYRSGMKFWLEICKSLIQVTHPDVYNFYKHCIRGNFNQVV